MSGTTTVVYNGPFRDGLWLTDGTHIPYARPVELPSDLAREFLDERPDEFHRPKPAKKAAAPAPVADPETAAAEES